MDRVDNVKNQIDACASVLHKKLYAVRCNFSARRIYRLSFDKKYKKDGSNGKSKMLF